MESPSPIPPLALSRILVHPVESIEQTRQRLFRYAGSVVAHRDHRGVLMARQCNVHHCGWRRITDGVANHILDRAPQQLRISVNRHRFSRTVLQRAFVRRRFQAGLLHQLLHQLVQPHRVAPQ